MPNISVPRTSRRANRCNLVLCVHPNVAQVTFPNPIVLFARQGLVVGVVLIFILPLSVLDHHHNFNHNNICNNGGFKVSGVVFAISIRLRQTDVG